MILQPAGDFWKKVRTSSGGFTVIEIFYVRHDTGLLLTTPSFIILSDHS